MESEAVRAIVLGILQGLTEFLPISSSGHLLVLPWLLGWEPMGLDFDVILHAGTLLAVLIYFRRDLVKVALEPLGGIRNLHNREGNLLLPIVVGTIPAVLVGLAFREIIEQQLRTPWVVVGTLAGIGLLLAWVDRTGKGNRDFASLGWKHSLLIGLAQSLSLVPGVSRSGVTIVAALWLGFTRADSARFSFLLAIPLIGGATAVKGLEAVLAESGQGVPLLPLLLGVVFSFVSGFLCIKYFLRFLQLRSFLPFAVYRLLLAGFICWWLLA